MAAQTRSHVAGEAPLRVYTLNACSKDSTQHDADTCTGLIVSFDGHCLQGERTEKIGFSKTKIPSLRLTRLFLN